MKLLKNIFRVALANIANFGSSFLVGFILPAVLTVAAYGHYKEYTLYLSFVYIFNLGFNDGVYIKYGGKDPESVNREELHEEHNFITVFQFIIFIGMMAVSLFLQDPILILFSIVTFFRVLTTYHQNFAQATGDFKLFSNGNILKSIIYIGTLLFAMFVLRSDNYLVYVLMSVLSHITIYLLYEITYIKRYGYRKTLNLKGKFNLFYVGIFILLANMSLTFVGNVGSWVVNFGFDVESFAQYSFQNSVLNLILLIVNAVGMVFYNVISQHENQTMLKLTKRICLFLGVFSGLGFFAFRWVIEYFLPQYVQAVDLLSITFISIPYIMVTKIIIANLYKSRKNEKKYLKDVGLFALAAFGVVVAVYYLTHSLEAIALATTGAYIVWFLYTTRIEYNYLKSTNKELLLLLSHFIVFFFTSNQLTILQGAIAYFFYIVVVTVLFKKEFKGLIDYARK